MSKLEALIQEYCPEGVEYRALGEVCEIKTGKLNANAMEPDGIYPFFTCSENVYTINTYAFDCEALLIAGNGYIGNVKHYVGRFNAYQRTYVLVDFVQDTLVRYLYFYLLAYFRDYALSMQREGSVPYITLGVLQDFEIPVPPLAVQEEIVRILDNFSLLSAELEAELEGRRKQYDFYRNQLLSFEANAQFASDGRGLTSSVPVQWKKLGEVCEIGTGSHNTQDGLEEGIYPFYTRGIDILRLNSYDYDETAIITAGDGAGVGKVFHFVMGCYALHQRAYRIVPNQNMVLARYVYYYITTTFYNYIMRSSVSSSVTSIRKPMLLDYPIPIPPLAEQQRIVDILDRFDTLTNDLTSGLPAEIAARKQQYEYYRDKLLTFKRKDA